MNPEPTPDHDPLSATPEEQKLLRQLRGNPMLSEQFKVIANKFEQEISNGMDAHQAEAALIESLQELGRGLMHQWAMNTQDKLVTQRPELHKHSKKNSSGTPPSE
jgi:hypothetical protein